MFTISMPTGGLGMAHKWIPRTAEQAYKRAAGRRRYHAKRQRQRDERQLRLIQLLTKLNWKTHGTGKMLADQFSVHPATISRDTRYIRKIRAAFVKRYGERVADLTMESLVRAGIHPRP